jgi:DNA-binding CsgD family transcriptional regulator
MDAIPPEDVRKIIHILGQIAVTEGDLPFKRRLLLEGIGELLQADYWFWIQFKDEFNGNRPIPFSLVVGGPASQARQLKFAEGITAPAAEFLNARLREGSERHITRRRIDMFDDDIWLSSELQKRYFEPAGFGEFLSSVYPLGDKFFSSICFVRGLGQPPFTGREVCIVHLITEEIDWLHRQGIDVPAGLQIPELSTRQRQVLLRVMAGDSEKQIARLLSLSPHTVHDHMKQIYLRFGVNSRTELLAMFFGGGASISKGSPPQNPA